MTQSMNLRDLDLLHVATEQYPVLGVGPELGLLALKIKLTN